MNENYPTGRAGGMERLGRLQDFEVADNSPDIRGWQVASADDRNIGRVDDLIVDTGQMRARYMLIDVTATSRGGTRGDGHQVLVPLERARLSEAEHIVRLDMAAAGAEQLPRFSGSYSSDYDDQFRRSAPPAAAAEHGSAGGHEQRITRSAEELRIGRRQVPAGEVTVSKHVETEHVREPVERMREDVRVERRPVSGQAGRAELREDEIRIPVSEEELVVEKRPVVKEEIVITKETTSERVDVEADLKQERVDVDRTGKRTTGERPAGKRDRH